MRLTKLILLFTLTVLFTLSSLLRDFTYNGLIS